MCLQSGDPEHARQILANGKSTLDQQIERHTDGSLVGSSLLNPGGALKHNAIIAEVLRL